MTPIVRCLAAPPQSRPMRKIVIAAAAGVIAAAALVVLGAGEWLSRPAARYVGAPPAALNASAVRLPLAGGGHVAGWHAPGATGGGAVLLLHGVRSDRRQMLGRARFLQAAGYGVLLVDLPAHGESPGERITFGARESAGAAAALAYLRATTPGERVGVIGISLGAASLVLARPAPAPAAVILESMYPTIDEAVADRLALHVGSAARALAPLLLAQLPWRLGVGADALRPIDALPALRAPLLMASGREDRHTPWAETERLLRAASEPKEVWAVEGAAHVDLHVHTPAEYERRVLRFLGRHLRVTPPQDAAAAAASAGRSRSTG
jgi:uncharacterized protein